MKRWKSLHGRISCYSNLYRTLSDFHHGKVILKNTPLITNLEVTSRCNLACPFCARPVIFNHRGFADMNMNLFQKILDENPDSFQDVCMFHHGEPLLHPQLATMVQMIRPLVKGKITITTNGLLLTPEKYDELLECGLDIMVFSFEPKEVYKETRGGDYSKVEANINYALDKPQSIPVYINCIQNKLTEPFLPRFAEHWQAKGASVKLQCEGDWLLKTPKGVGVSDPCPIFWVGGVVYHDGTVGPCCVWIHEVFADLKLGSFKEQWNNEAYVNMRKLHLTDRREHEWCGRCIHYRFHANSVYRFPRNPNFPFDSRYAKYLFAVLRGKSDGKYF